MPLTNDLKGLLDDRSKTGTRQNAIIEASAEELLDPIETVVQEGQDMKDALSTSRPEDLRALHDISGTPTGAALQTAIDKQKNIGQLKFLKTALETYLDNNFTFAGGSTVVVTYHAEVENDPKHDDWNTFTVRIPASDDVGPISLDDAGIIAEIDRVCPKWHYTVVNTTASRSGKHIKDVTSDDTGTSEVNVDVVPESPFNVVADSSDEEIVDREAREVDWISPQIARKVADNVINGEDLEQILEVEGNVRIEASSSFIDEVRTFSEIITASSALLGGFEEKEPVINNVGITAVSAKESEILRAGLHVEEDLVSLGQLPSVQLLDPEEEFPITIVEELRLIDNDKKGETILIGSHLIHHEYLTGNSITVTKLAGKTIRVFVQPLEGGYGDKERIINTELIVVEEYIPLDPNLRKLPTGQIEVEYARQWFDGPSDREIDKVPVKTDEDVEASLNLKVIGFSPGSQQSGSGGAKPGMISIPIKAPYSQKGVTGVSGFLPINDDQYYNVQKMNVEADFVAITIKQSSGGGGTANQSTFSSTGFVVLENKPEYSMLPNQGVCKTLAVVVQNFANLFSFSAAAANLVDMKFEIDFKIDLIYDRVELRYGQNAARPDITYTEFRPDQTYKCIDARLSPAVPVNPGQTDWMLDERLIEDIFGQADPDPNEISIAVHELKYDANKIPPSGIQVKAFATYDISSEDNEQNFSVSIPTPSGHICDKVTLLWERKGGFNIQTVVINVTDPSIVDGIVGGPIFKTVHLDQITDNTKTIEESIENVIVFYDDNLMEDDAVVKIKAHFVPYDPTLQIDSLESLESISFSTYDELPITGWEMKVDDVTFTDYWDAFFTEKDTNNIIDDPTNKLITGGIIYYYPKDLDEDGSKVEVFVTYGQGGVGPEAKDIGVLSINVPEGEVLDFDLIDAVIGRPSGDGTPFDYEDLYYIDSVGVIHDNLVGNFEVKTLEIHYDQTGIPDDGTFLEVYCNYGAPPLGNNREDFLSFGTNSSLFLKSVSFTGLTPRVIKYDTPDFGIISSLPAAGAKVNNVLVIFDSFDVPFDKVEVEFSATYLKPLKEVTYPIRQDWTVEDIDYAPVVGGSALVKEIWIKGEFDRYHNINYFISKDYRPQRLEAIRVLLYDSDLSTDQGDELEGLTVDIREILNYKMNPFLEGSKVWKSPSGGDEQYRIDLNGVTVNRIDVTGNTGVAQPITVIDKWEQPYVPGKEYRPSSIILYYSEISNIEIAYDINHQISYNHRNNVLFDDTGYWKSEVRTDNEKLEIESGGLLMNQLIVDLDSTSMTLSQITMRIGTGDNEFLTTSFTPGSTSTSATQIFLKGSTKLVVASTANIQDHDILDVNGDYVRVQRVVDSTSLDIDPLAANVPASTTVRIVGRDFGDEPINAGRFYIEFDKGGVSGFVSVRQIRPRLEDRFRQRNLPRNVIVRDSKYWSSSQNDSPDTDAKITLHYDSPVVINRVDVEEAVKSDYKVTILTPDTDREREIYLSEDINSRGFIYTDPNKVDHPEFSPEPIKVKTVEFAWETLPRNGETGSYQTKVIRLIPQFSYDALSSSTRAMLDNNLKTKWMSRIAADAADDIIFVVDLGQVYTVNRVLINTQSAGAAATLEYSLGENEKGYQSWGSIADIGAAASTTSSVLTAQANPTDTSVTVTSSAGFEVGRYINIRDDVNTVGEFRKITSISGNVLNFTPGLGLTYTLANNALAEQSNIICPGWYLPIVVGEACVGDHVRGATWFDDAFTLSSVDARFIRFTVDNVPIDPGTGQRRLIINSLDIFRDVTVS